MIDASVAACWALADESHQIADLALERAGREETLAPALFWFEVRNILVVSERRKRITEVRTMTFLRELPHLVPEVDRSPNEGEVMRLARKHKLTVYDAAYLELASRIGGSLASLDGDLVKAARKEGVRVLQAKLP